MSYEGYNKKKQVGVYMYVLTCTCTIYMYTDLYIHIHVHRVPPLLTCVVSNSRRLQRLEHLAAKFEHKASNIEKWAADHPEKLSRNDDIEAANLAEATVSAGLTHQSV